jgi:uncharacterized protein YjiS (DUF1127 family)
MHTISSTPGFSRTLAALGFQRQWRPAGLSSGLRRLLEVLFVWQDRASQRRALQQLDDRLLKDLGLGRGDVAREADKPFWQP